MSPQEFRRRENWKDFKYILNFVLTYGVFFGLMIFGYLSIVLLWAADDKFDKPATYLSRQLNER